MPVVRFYLNDDAYAELVQCAEESKMSVQDYVRSKCLPSRKTELSVDDVVAAIETQKPMGEFKISDLFPAEVWLNVSIGVRAYLGKTFYEQVDAGKIQGVVFTGMRKRIAHYKVQE